MTAENMKTETVTPTVRLYHVGSTEDPAGCGMDVTWAFVPRANEYMDIACPDHGHHIGTVRNIGWTETGIPLVNYR